MKTKHINIIVAISAGVVLYAMFMIFLGASQAAPVCPRGTTKEFLGQLTMEGIPYKEEKREDVKAALREMYNKTPPFAAMVDNENAAVMFVSPAGGGNIAVALGSKNGCLTTGIFLDASDYPAGSSI